MPPAIKGDTRAKDFKPDLKEIENILACEISLDQGQGIPLPTDTVNF